MLFVDMEGTQKVMKIKIIIFLSLFSENLRLNLAKPYLKFCGENSKFMIEGKTCPSGVWLSKPLTPRYLCASGVWVLMEHECDELFSLYVGNGDCWLTTGEVRSIKYLGNFKDAFTQRYLIAPSTFEFYNKIARKNNPKDITIKPTRPLIISLNPKNQIRRLNDPICLLPPKTNETFVYLYHDEYGAPTKWIHETQGGAENCTVLEYTHKLRAGEVYRGGRVVEKQSGSLLVEPYSKSCPKKASSAGVINIGSQLAFVEPTVGKEFTDLKEWEEETKEQNVRLLQAVLNPVLLNIPTVKIFTPEYKYFQKARLILLATCPSLIVPKFLLNGLTRMWRLVFSENHERINHWDQHGQDQFNRVMNGMNQCLTNSEMFEFVVGHDDTDTTKSHVHQQCKLGLTAKETKAIPSFCMDLVWRVKGRDYTGKSQLVEGHLPGYLKYHKKLDIVIETAWKIVMFTHYHCAEYFSESPIDHSHLMNRLQSFFNRNVIRRWHSNYNFYRIVELLFSSYDLVLFSEGMDRCVGAARDLSEYKQWMLRPKIPMTSDDITSARRTKRSGFRSVPHGKVEAHCINRLKDDPAKFFVNNKEQLTLDCYRKF